MGRSILVDVVLGAGAASILLSALWYAWFARHNRQRAGTILRWFEAACLGKARVDHVEWQRSSSVLKATVDLSSRWFEDANLTIRFLPRPLPMQWALSRWNGQQETLTFEANLGFPPGFHLDVIRHRWSGHTGSKKSIAGMDTLGEGPAKAKSKKTMRTWAVTRPGPVILTTKEDWPMELSPVVNALASWRDKDFLGVRFHPTAPHFTATVDLEHLSDQKSAAALLGLFRELAASSSAKQH